MSIYMCRVLCVKCYKCTPPILPYSLTTLTTKNGLEGAILQNVSRKKQPRYAYYKGTKM
jgi:hypothetical protein